MPLPAISADHPTRAATRRRFVALALALMWLTGAASTARAEDLAVLRVAADTAFAAADYPKAIALYEKILPTLSDPSSADAMAERIRFARRQLELARLATTQPTVANAPATAPTTAPAADGARIPHVPPKPGETRELTLHELGNFEYSQDDDAQIPEDVQKLSGMKIRIPGQMVPIDQTGKITRFLLVNDLMSCCYGTAPKLQHVALVLLPNGKFIPPTTERLMIEGTLTVKVKKEDGIVISLFEIEPSSIKFAAQ